MHKNDLKCFVIDKELKLFIVKLDRWLFGIHGLQNWIFILSFFHVLVFCLHAYLCTMCVEDSRQCQISLVSY